ncbi:small GTP-binding protein [Histomonas meleagridis]|uniref:small GTP-binding protein n=1 Tax=Histomonas meleagridis TaxID=135588 RepID=UPI003559C55B|nr:small GTP-binding protein [Histomonas meleagridis]KAH0805740.1 small GTP-binding protein [Histomonas meleagridis]
MSKKTDVSLPTLAKMKIMLVGDSSVGKSSLLDRYINNQFSEQKPTLGIDYASKRLDVKNIPTYVHFWDPSGDDMYFEIRNEFYQESDGIILCYDCSNKETFNKLSNWIDEGNKNKANWSSMIIVGNKSDLGKSVSIEEANAFAKRLGAQSFQVSSKTGEGVESAVNTLLEIIQKKRDNAYIPDTKVTNESNSVGKKHRKM